MLLAPLLCSIFIFTCMKNVGAELKPVSILALGRPFSLGDLYDRRRDTIVQGPKLWRYDELDNFSESKSYSTKFEIVTSETIDEDMKHFDLSASIRMSFLAGLVTVSGSASYLDDRKKKNNQARVSLNYKSTTFKRELKPSMFTKITYPDVLKKATDATDVVVAIQYGAGAIFTFDRSVSQNEHKRDVKGTLAVAVKKIPTFEVSGEGKVEITEQDRKNTDAFTCKFHGDFVLRNHPGTYQEAIKVYKELPELLGQNYENSVPVKVWLYPLEKLPLSRAAQVVYDIKESLVVSVTDQIEDLQNIIRQCNDILDSQVSTHHARIRVKVDDFKSYVERYVLLYKQRLVSILPDIRRGTVSMSQLTKLVTDKESSPFAQRNLQLWISRLNEEVSVLSRIQSLPNYCRDDGDFSAKLLRGKKYTLGLTLKIGKTEDGYLDAIREFLVTEQNGRLPSQNIAKWWRPGSMTLYNLQVLSSTFRKFHQIKEKESENSLSSPEVQFLVREDIIESGKSEEIVIELYNGAWLSKKSYHLTSAPGRPKFLSKTHQMIKIGWKRPEKGFENLKRFIVRCYTVRTKGMSDGCEGNYCKVAEIHISRSLLSTDIEGLKSSTPYYFTVASLTELGETATSDSSEQIDTHKCIPGFYDVGDRNCKKCDKGTYSRYYGSKSCSKCPRGTYGDALGLKNSASCKRCPAGTYSDKEGLDSVSGCTRCPTGTYNENTGSKTASYCRKCPKGTYSSNTGQMKRNSCVKCKVNTYNNLEGAAQCRSCPTGTQTKNTGSVYVSECQSPKGSQQIQAQLNSMKTQVTNELQDFQNDIKQSEKQVSDALKKLEADKSGVAKIVSEEIKGIQSELKNIFSCSWAYGNGISSKKVYVGPVSALESCAYKCLRKREESGFQDINGATIIKSNKACYCEKAQRGRNTRESSYLNCQFSL